ncbi:copper chaperone PCu(A)C [Prosthecomicrobium pneumaticum]|uniref:Copper chaperone PCu(A)C n=1 Tax=Prosthecomicrobium pneumaticum TaxID=81895 RepID=A0A7W9FJU2_9HYPH|nr:copper chaperone PCu(A)C [Prosthecomicrobium pneumaticum]MBB5752082.1 hypothetical protein [Prosthecomicrobium pneumaticum]
MNRRFSRLSGALFALFLAAAPAAAHEVKVGAIEITDLWARATPPAAPAAGGFLTITNHGSEPDRLISAASDAAEKVEIHEMKTENGTMIMRPVAGGVDIPAGGTVALAPGGYHIMFIRPKAPLVEGGKVAVTLTFEKAGAVDTFLHILPVGSPGPKPDADAGHAGGHDHQHMNMGQ